MWADDVANGWRFIAIKFIDTFTYRLYSIANCICNSIKMVKIWCITEFTQDANFSLLWKNGILATK